MIMPTAAWRGSQLNNTFGLSPNYNLPILFLFSFRPTSVNLVYLGKTVSLCRSYQNIFRKSDKLSFWQDSVH